MRTIQGIARLPLLALSLSFIIGIALGAALPLDVQTWLAIAAALLLIMLTAPRIFRWLAVHRPGVVRAVLLARSGDQDYNPPEWLSVARPRLVVVSVSAYNRGSLPDAALMESLNGYPILRTDLNGSIELVTDGTQMWVYAEKN